MKRFTIIFLAIICIVLCVASCKDNNSTASEYVSKYIDDYKYDGSSLVGVWQESNYKDEEYQTYEFFENGNVACTVYSFGIEMGRLDATYKIEDDNTLVINWENSTKTDKNKFSINKDKYLVICQVVDSSTLEMELVPYNMSYNSSDNDLVGTWISTSDATESFTFYDNYTGYSAGLSEAYSFDYSIKDSVVFFSFEFVDGFKAPVDAMEYKIDGDILTLEGQDKDENKIILTFKKAD